MSDVTHSQEIARANVDEAIYHYVKFWGHNPDDFDYSQFNELLDELERLA